jgi:TIR domain
MSYVPGWQYDLFISYASENNRDRWVQLFNDALSVELRELLGTHFSEKYIYLDKTGLRVGQSFPNELEAAAEASAMLVPILSPSYVTSEWCTRERNAFLKTVRDSCGRSERLAPILVRAVEEGSLGILHEAQFVSFLSRDGQTPWSIASPEWVALLNQFAAQVRDALRSLRKKYTPVFLGRTTNPQSRAVRKRCVEELAKRCFRVVPEAETELEYEHALSRNLSEAALAVHFVGGADDWATSAIEISTEACRGATVLYQPFSSTLTPTEEVWLHEFENDLAARPGKYQRLTGKNDQELIDVLEQELANLATPSAGPSRSVGLGLVCDEKDLEIARSLKAAIESKDQIEVQYPAFLQGRVSPSEKMRRWSELLRTSKGLLFCWGAADVERLEAIWRLADKERPDGHRAWYLTPPNVEAKEQRYPSAIRQASGFEYGPLSEFLTPLRSERGASP